MLSFFRCIRLEANTYGVLGVNARSRRCNARMELPTPGGPRLDWFHAATFRAAHPGRPEAKASTYYSEVSPQQVRQVEGRCMAVFMFLNVIDHNHRAARGLIVYTPAARGSIISTPWGCPPWAARGSMICRGVALPTLGGMYVDFR